MRRTPATLSSILVFAAAATAHADTGGAAAPSSASDSAALIADVSIGPAAGGADRPISIRFVSDRATDVTARLLVMRSDAPGVVAHRALGRVAVGSTRIVRWHAMSHLQPGRYIVRVGARDDEGRQLQRTAEAPGSASLVIAGPRGQTPSLPDGVFPVAGPFSYGDGFGAPRPGYKHQGQDMAAAQGTPVVAPESGSVVATGYQADAAGEYVVMAAGERSYMFAHCQRRSTAVATGRSIDAGARVCLVGSTGRATGPHLHFEIWLDGWRTGTASHPIDPRPQLEAWQG